MMQKKLERGFVALISTLMVSAALLAFVVSAGAWNFYARLDSFGLENKRVSRAHAEACVEVALLALATSTDPVAYNPTNFKVFIEGENTCTIARVIHSTSTATLDTYASVGNSYSSATVTVDLESDVKVLSWESH